MDSCKVICINTGEVFSSFGDASRHMGIERSNISAHLAGNKKSVKGYVFKKITGNESPDELKQICLDALRDDFKITLPLTVGDECDG